MIANKCPNCGVIAPLSPRPVIPLQLGILPPQRDTVYLCSNCHEEADLNSLREYEFEIVVADLMVTNDQFSMVRMTGEIDNSKPHVIPDITAWSADGTRKIYVECMSLQTITSNKLMDSIEHVKRYRTGNEQLILAFPARLTSDQRQLISEAGIDVWDLDALVTFFKKTLSRVTHPILRPLMFATAAILDAQNNPSPESQLLKELQNLPSGRAYWPAYQKLTARILERLFCPPLSSPISELSDFTGTNRRDIILPNYAEKGFWAFIRHRYAADYIVVDAKNYRGPVGKKEALQILNYLKPHGAGQFAMIMCRNGFDNSCDTTLREKWTVEDKMVIVLSDEHVERMLLAKEAGGPPEDVVRQCIEEFRLSI